MAFLAPQRSLSLSLSTLTINCLSSSLYLVSCSSMYVYTHTHTHTHAQCECRDCQNNKPAASEGEGAAGAATATLTNTKKRKFIPEDPSSSLANGVCLSICPWFPPPRSSLSSRIEAKETFYRGKRDLHRCKKDLLYPPLSSSSPHYMLI